MRLPSHVRLLDASRAGDQEPVDKLAFEIALASSLRRGDLVLCVEGDTVPTDGVVVEGRASLALLSGGAPEPEAHEHLSVRRGCRLASGYLVVRVTG